MFALNMIAGTGLIFSFIIHILTMLSLFQPANAVIITQNVIIGILLLALGVITKKMNYGLNREVFKKRLLGEMFNGREVTVFVTFISSLYGVAIFSFFLFKAFQYAWDPSETTHVANEAFYKGLSSLLMTFFAIEYLFLYCFKALKESYIKRCRCGHANSILAVHCQSCSIRDMETIMFTIEKNDK